MTTAAAEVLAAADWERARELYAAALEEDESAQALDGLGQALWWLGETEQGVEMRAAWLATYAAGIGWARGLTERMRPYSIAGAAPNFFSPEGSERLRSTFGAEKYDRLVALKREWDPENVFSWNQNVKPGPGPRG